MPFSFVKGISEAPRSFQHRYGFNSWNDIGDASIYSALVVLANKDLFFGNQYTGD